MHMRVPKTGNYALAAAIHDLRGVADPRLDPCLVSDVNEFTVPDGNRLRVRFRSVQCNGINLRVPLNLVCNLCHMNSAFRFV